MTILLHHSIRREMRRSHILIDPFDEKYLGNASIELRLGYWLCPVESMCRDIYLHEIEKIDPLDWLNPVGLSDGRTYSLVPGRLVLALTLEYIELGARICARFDGRNRFARYGLEVHKTPSFIGPGSKGHQVLELENRGRDPIILSAGFPICQIIFEQCA